MIKTCPACNREFEGHFNAVVCSEECRKARRRGLAIGLPAAPPPTRECVVCGKVFTYDRGCTNTCSLDCRLIRDRAKFRAEYYHRIAVDPEYGRKAGQRRKAKVAVDPELAAKVKAWDAAKMARHQHRMATDPEYAERHRRRAREKYTAKAAEVQAKRAAKLKAMSDEELLAYRARARQYAKKHHGRRKADPVIRQRDAAMQAEYRRRRREERTAIDMARLNEAMKEPGTIKPCGVVASRSSARKPEPNSALSAVPI